MPDRRHGRAGNRGRLAALVVAVVLMGISACGVGPGLPASSGPAGSGKSSFAGTVVEPPVQLPPAVLTATSGRRFDLRRDTSAPITLVVFGYTTCPDECPLTVSTIAAAVRLLSARQRAAVDVLVLSADPARDTPVAMRAWLDRFDPAFEGLTGDPAVLKAVAAGLYIPLETGGGSPDPTGPSASAADGVSHGTSIYAFGSRDTSLLLWGSLPAPAELAADLRRLLQAR